LAVFARFLPIFCPFLPVFAHVGPNLPFGAGFGVLSAHAPSFETLARLFTLKAALFTLYFLPVSRKS
jgi:hypothetical protein